MTTDREATRVATALSDGQTNDPAERDPTGEDSRETGRFEAGGG